MKKKKKLLEEKRQNCWAMKKYLRLCQLLKVNNITKLLCFFTFFFRKDGLILKIDINSHLTFNWLKIIKSQVCCVPELVYVVCTKAER